MTARYVAWLVSPEQEGEGNYMEISKTFLSIQLSPTSAEKKEKGKGEQEEKETEGKKKVDREVLEIICGLPLPRELALLVLSKYISDRVIYAAEVSFLV